MDRVGLVEEIRTEVCEGCSHYNQTTCRKRACTVVNEWLEDKVIDQHGRSKFDADTIVNSEMINHDQQGTIEYLEGRIEELEEKYNGVYGELKKERDRQDLIWGETNHLPHKWLPILGKKIGEVSTEILNGNKEKYRKELIQTAAVVVAMVESLDRN